MQISENVEHICLSSGDESGQETDIGATSGQERVTNGELTQVSRLRRSQARFTVFNDHYVAVETTGFGRKARYFEFDLAFLQRRPVSLRRIDWVSALGAVTLFGAAVMAGMALEPAQAFTIVPALAIGCAVALALMVYRSCDRIVFVSKHGRVPLIVLLNEKRRQAELQTFVSDIRQRIKATRNKWSDKREFLSAELREHRQLKEQGGLTEVGYERVKQRILRNHA